MKSDSRISLAMMVTQYAQNEQNMNAVERVLVYAELPTEGDLEKPSDPPPEWPERGAIRFEDVKMAYREGLPDVLRGVTFEIKAGEKVGTIHNILHRSHFMVGRYCG